MPETRMRARNLGHAVVYMYSDKAVAVCDRNSDFSSPAYTFDAVVYGILDKWLKRQVGDRYLRKLLRQIPLHP